jgi:cytochrome c oxidase subunit III
MAGEATKQIAPEILWGGGRSPFSTSYGKMMNWFFLVSDALTFGGLLVAYGFARYKYTGEWPIGDVVFESLPFLGGGYPLIYVALMTFILIISSVTMVLAVEAGHRMDKRGVIKWMIWTVIGGFFFLSSQAWEWYHFIHGGEGYYVLEDGRRIAYADDSKNAVYVIPEGASAYSLSSTQVTPDQLIEGSQAKAMIEGAIHHVQGANMVENEYGPAQYANFFFFITGFHGFHVFSGVVLNIIILINCIRGVYHKRGHYEMVEKTGLYWHFVDLVWVFVFTFFYLI